MPVRFTTTACIALAVLSMVLSPALVAEQPQTASAQAAEEVDFARDIQPLFATRCYECHGPETQESGLRLDTKSRALAGGDSGSVINPGSSAESLLIDYVTGADPDSVMPPEGEPLIEEQITLLRKWIDQGAVWPDSADGDAQHLGNDHWAWQPLEPQAAPRLDDTDWIANPIDAFVLSRLQANNVEPSPQADAYTLIRRLSLDLLGLPPQREDVEEFYVDSSPQAYENLVDRLLGSAHFGERWGRHWLDKARYADSDGYEKDRPRPNAWRWRDWVIDAINRDMPFDQFTVEQFAGDLLPEADEMQKLATAFHRQTLTNTEGGTDQEQFRVEAVFDRVETAGTVWLGMTVGCARCHSHKYDPITQRDYYRLFAFFNNGDETDTNVRISDAEVARHAAEQAEHDSALAELQAGLDEAKAQLEPAQLQWEQKAQALIEAEAEDPPQFHPMQIVSTAGGGESFETLDDGSIRVAGPSANTAEYTIVAATDVRPISGFRLEVLTDDTLPAKGPGRKDNGNFVLTDFRVSPAASEESLDWGFARADHAQDKFPPAGAIDDDKKKSGWAVGGAIGQNHSAVFNLAEPLSVDAGLAEFSFVLSQHYGGGHTIGRFRISAMTGIEPDPMLPDEIRKILAVAPDARDEQQHSALAEHYVHVDPTTAGLLNQIEQLQKNPPKSPNMKVRVIGERTENLRTTHMLRRGDFLQPTGEVTPGVIEVLENLRPKDSELPDNRLELARWLVSADNPLSARVAVNHVWSHLFGAGLVRTPNDFGTRGEPPTHPELLDWLAAQYIELGWSRKALIKLIVMSSTYRQSSQHRPQLAEVDPLNTLLHRQNRYRVDAEIVRDLSLSVAGLLSSKIGGPSVFPPMPADVAALSYANNFKWKTSEGADRYRRGMYTFYKRTAPHPNLTTFDCPDANITCVQRSASNTPLQALTTLNNVVFVEASQAMAQRMLMLDLADDSARLSEAVRQSIVRPPTNAELRQFNDLLVESRAWYGEHQEAAEQLVGEYKVEGASMAENAAWITVCRILLNLDAFLTRE